MASSSQSLEKFGPPSLGPQTDAGKAFKLAQRVEKTLLSCLNPEPKQLPPETLLPAPENRDGAPPNIQYIHFGILKSLAEKGFDRTRPAIGICVAYKSPEGKARLLEHARRYTKGNKLFPPIVEDQVMYGTLAGSHLNVSLRLLKAGVQSPAVDVSSMVEPGSSLEEVVKHGHRWWILPEETPHEALVEVSLWRNQDQNENQSLHEVEVLRNIMATCAEQAVTTSSMQLGDIAARAARRNPAKVAQGTILILAKFYIKFYTEEHRHLADELVDWHACRVNPREIVVSANYIRTLAEETGFAGAPHTRLYLLLAAYTPEKARSCAGGPSQANFLEVSQVVGLSKKPDFVKLLEDLFVEGRSKYVPILERQAPRAQALQEFSDLAITYIRCILAKPFDKSLGIKGSSGKLTKEKALGLASSWAELMDQKFPDLDFGKASGLLQEDPNVEDRDGSRQVVSLGGLAEGAGGASGDVGDIGSLLKPGDVVVVIRRFTWHIKVPGKEDFRKDIAVGTKGALKGYADEGHRQVLVSFELNLPTGRGSNMAPREVTDKALPRNLQKLEDYEAEKAAEAGAQQAEEAASSARRAPQVPPSYAWVSEDIPDEERTKVIVEKNWENLDDFKGKLWRLFALKGKVAAGASAVLESLPQFGPKDLAIIHRANKSGAFKTEVWTMRAFAAKELMIPVFSSELKDLLWTKNLYALVGLPTHGPGKHPDGKDLGFDGRGRNRLAASGNIDDSEHRGMLGWIIERTPDENLGNLELDQATWSSEVAIKLPGGKKRKTSVSWPSESMPGLPIIINPRPLKAHTRLWLYFVSAKSKDGSSPGPDSASKGKDASGST